MTHTIKTSTDGSYQLIQKYPLEMFKEINDLKKKFVYWHTHHADKPTLKNFDFRLLSKDLEGLKQMKKLINKFFKIHFEKHYINHYFEFDKSKYDHGINEIAESNNKIWNNLSLLNSSCDQCIELHKLPHNATIYISTVGLIRSDGNGNHGKYNVFYVKKGKLEKIFIPAFMKQDKHHNWVFTRSGGNYSFTHDLNCELSLIREKTFEKMVKEDPQKYGKDQNSYRNYGFFNYQEI